VRTVSQKVWRPLKNVQFWPSTRKAIISTTGILLVFRGLQFETDAVIGQKGALCKVSDGVFLIFFHIVLKIKSKPTGGLYKNEFTESEERNVWAS